MVRAALVQFGGHESKEINIRKAEDLARQAAGNGARIICFPELATTIYFCFDRDRKSYFGSAVFIDPRGTVIGRAGDKENEILYADIDPRVCDDTRDLWGFFKFRRPDAYGEIVGGTV